MTQVNDRVEWLAIWMKDRYEPSFHPWADLPEVVREKWRLEARDILRAIASLDEPSP